MRAGLNINVILSLVASFLSLTTAALAPAPLHSCVDGQCDRVSKVMLSCQQIGVGAAELTKCVCASDPTWNHDIIDCAICWLDPVPNGGNAYELGAILDDSSRITCGTGPSSSANLTSCLVPTTPCSAIWKVGEVCGSFGADAQVCICKYKYVWDPYTFASCPTCIEKQGDKALADEIRAWEGFNCPTTSSSSSSSSSTTPTPTPNGAARANGLGVSVLAIIAAVGVAGMF